MQKTYTLIRRDGTKEEVPFFIANGRCYIPDHISQAEFGQHDDGATVIFEPLIKLFEAIRLAANEPVVINSGYRSKEYQEKLYQYDLESNQGKPSGLVTKPGNSPHMFGVAMDLGIPKSFSAQNFVRLIQQECVDLRYPMARIGWRKYRGVFVHIDLIHMLFEPYLPGVQNPDPVNWTPGVSW